MKIPSGQKTGVFTFLLLLTTTYAWATPGILPTSQHSQQNRLRGQEESSAIAAQIHDITTPVPDSLVPLGLCLENYAYPYPVKYITLNLQHQTLKMA